MDAEQARAFLLALPHVVETKQWGENLVFWAGDKAIGGKMFCLVNLDPGGGGVISYAAGPERYHELLEREGLYPAPYMARIHWVAAERWSALRSAEWQQELRAAYDLTFAKLTKGTLEVLVLPAKARAKRIAEGRKIRAERDAAEKKRKAARKAAQSKTKKTKSKG